MKSCHAEIKTRHSKINTHRYKLQRFPPNPIGIFPFTYICSVKAVVRRSFTILLLAILGFSQFGYYLSNSISIAQCHEQRDEQFAAEHESEKLVVIDYAANKTSIRWEDDNEFYLNNEIYDLVKHEKVNGKDLLYCVNDSKEKQLINQRDDQTAHNTDNGKKQKAISIDLVFTCDHTVIDTTELNIPSSNFDQIIYSQQLSQGNNDDVFMPPRVFILS
jgi:hypothetical protein